MTPKETRATLGVTIAQMVRLCDVPRSTWNSWEREERSPDRAASRLLSLIVWLRDNAPSVYQRLLDNG